MTTSTSLGEMDEEWHDKDKDTNAKPQVKPGKDKPRPWQPVFAHSGFHSDPYLLKLVDYLVPSVTTFIETGTEAGSTLAYMGRIYPWLDCWSSELNPDMAKIAERNLRNHNQSKVHLVNRPSIELLEMITGQFGVDKEPTLFWLDAHSHGGGCPVRGEVDFIISHWKSGWILIDDFKVPHRLEFGFDTYSDGELSATSRMMGLQKPIHYPDYNPPFGARGWCLISISDSIPIPISIPLR